MPNPRAVVELFTSQGCSSCPPADKIVGELAKDPNVIALSMPIDYWDYLGWKDTLADSRFSARQKAYSHVRGDRNLYTPQMIVNGSAQVIGSDRAAIDGAIKNTSKAEGVMSVPVTMTLSGKLINVSVEASKVATAGRGEVWLCSVSKAVPISIGRGGESRPASHLLQRGAQSREGRRLERRGGSWSIPLEKFPATASMPRSSMSRTAAATSRADARRGLHALRGILSTPNFPNGCAAACMPLILAPKYQQPVTKIENKDQLSLAQYGDKLGDFI